VDTKVSEIKEFSAGESDWLTNESDEYIIDHTQNMIAHSKMIQKSCEKYGFAYIDTSHNFEDAIEKACSSLIDNSHN